MSEAPIEGYIDPSIPNPNGPQDAPIIIYGYAPSLILAIIALILYAVLLFLHIIRLLLHRLYPFSSLFLTGTILELLGYIFRLRSTPPPVGDPYSVINFVLQYFFIVIAPVFFSAGIYTILTDLIRVFAKEGGRGRGGWRKQRKTLLGTFVAADVLATCVQVAGAALIGSAESNRKDPSTPNNILLGGLAFQVFTFALYLYLLGLFIFSHRKTVLYWGKDDDNDGSVAPFTIAVVVASLLIYLRTVFRLGETCQGVSGFAGSHEGLFGGLEFAPVVLAVGILGWWHPGKWISRRLV